MENKDEKLKAVFEVCDHNQNGYISVDHFKSLVTEHFGTSSEEEVVSIIQFLDPAGKGRISYLNFCEGVEQITQAINQGRSRTASTTSVISNNSLSEINDTQLDTLTFNKEPITRESQDNKVLGESDGCLVISKLSLLPQSNLLGQPLSEDDHDSALSGRSSEINETSRAEITDEENYEDYGESEIDLTIGSDVSDNGSRRITSTAFARHLHSRRDSLESGDEIVDDGISHLNDKVQVLSEQIRDLSKSHTESESRHITLKEENSTLVRKIHNLEEQIREMEYRSDERIKDEQNKHHMLIQRQDREKLEKLEYLTDRLHRSEIECDELKSHISTLQKEIEKLHYDKEYLNMRLSDVVEENTSLREEQELLMSRCNVQTREFEQERLATAGLLDELGKELDGLRKYKMNVEGEGMSNLPTRYHDLQVELQTVKDENQTLTLHNEELNAQMINMCMEEGRSLIQDTSNISWADEMENMDINQLKEALKEKQEQNERLNMYIQKIILKILEKQPSILEVKF